MSAKIKSIGLFITKMCNFSCKYCFIKKSNINMRPDQIPKILKLLKLFEINEISFFGGEPLLNFEFIKEFVKLADKTVKKKIRYSIITNGSLLTQKIANFLKNHNFKVAVSIDGPKYINDRYRIYPDGKGTYKDIIKGLNLLKSIGINVDTATVIAKHNYMFIDKILLWLENQGFHPYVQTIMETPENKEFSLNIEEFLTAWKKIIQIYKKNPVKYKGSVLPVTPFHILYKNLCPAASEKIIICPNLDVYPCEYLIGIKSFKLGNLNNINKLKRNIFKFLKFKNRELSGIYWFDSLFKICIAKRYLPNNKLSKIDTNGIKKIYLLEELLKWKKENINSFMIFFGLNKKEAEMFEIISKKIINEFKKPIK